MSKGNIQSVNTKYYLGAIRPMEWRNSKPNVSPGLSYNSNGSIVIFRDVQGNIKWIELRDGLFYECTPNNAIGTLLGGSGSDPTDDIQRANFKLIASETKTALQPAKYGLLNIVIKNNDPSSVNIKMKQPSDNYILGSENFGKLIPANTALFINQFTSDQEFYETAHDIVFVIDGTGKDIDVYMNFIKVY